MSELTDAQIPDDPQLRELVGAYRRELEPYMRERSPAPAKFFSWGGTRANVYSTLSSVGSDAAVPPSLLQRRNRVAVTLRGYGVPAPTFTAQDRRRLLSAGSVPVSAKIALVLATKLREIAGRGETLRWYQTRIVVGIGLEHHAVAVYRARNNVNHAERLAADTPAESFVGDDDLMFDPWITQTPQIYWFRDWVQHMWGERNVSGRLATAVTLNLRYAMARKDSLLVPSPPDRAAVHG